MNPRFPIYISKRRHDARCMTMRHLDAGMGVPYRASFVEASGVFSIRCCGLRWKVASPGTDPRYQREYDARMPLAGGKPRLRPRA